MNQNQPLASRRLIRDALDRNPRARRRRSQRGRAMSRDRFRVREDHQQNRFVALQRRARFRYVRRFEPARESARVSAECDRLYRRWKNVEPAQHRPQTVGEDQTFFEEWNLAAKREHAARDRRAHFEHAAQRDAVVRVTAFELRRESHRRARFGLRIEAAQNARVAFVLLGHRGQDDQIDFARVE